MSEPELPGDQSRDSSRLPTATGDAAVDAALTRLAALDPAASPAEHLPVLTEVHEALQQRLAAAAE